MGDTNTPRPAPTASGTLGKTPLVHLLVYALDKGLGGSIELVCPDRRSAAILFGGGRPMKVRTSEQVAHLGRVLLELGHVTEEELTVSLTALAKAKAAGPMLHGSLLVARGTIDEAKLAAGLREQLARKLNYVASLPGDTAYAYYDGFDVLRGWGGAGAGVDPVPLLWGILLANPPWDRVGPALRQIAASPIRLASQADLDRLALPREERAAAEAFRTAPTRIAEWTKSAGAGLGDGTAQLLAYLLLVTRQVDVLAATPQPPSTSTAPAARSVVPPGPSAAPPRHATAPPGQTSAPPPPPTGLTGELAQRWGEIIERAAGIDRSDYFAMLEVGRDATRDEIESAFLALAKRWHPDRLPPELAPVRDACSRVFARMSEAHAALVDEEQRGRYMGALADGSGSPETQAVLARVVGAATSFQKAEVCLRRNDNAQAESLCRQAVEGDPTQPDYHALLAWLVSLKPESQTPEATAACVQMLDRAVALSDRCEKAYFWRGMLQKKLGKPDAAMRDFRRAAELNPRNIDAVREVRLFHMRGGHTSSTPPAAKRSTPYPAKTEESAKPGLLGRWFKKPGG